MSVPDRLGDFAIVEEIGRGGFGVVYRAQQVSLERPVALKVLYEHRVHSKEELGRFEREAHAAARLDHPAVVSVYAWGQDADSGTFYLAQKLVGSGRTLADELAELKAEGEPPKGYYRRVAEHLASVADGLQHAHEHGIVHRDVKPSNVLLDDRGRPYLGDFGLAKVEDGLELSRTGDFAGSPYYMSPEQADSRRGPVDARTDVYALGATLYELLTLEPPFQARGAHEVLRKILTEDPRPPSRVSERVPKDLETICLKAMEKARSRRYQSAAEMAADLRAFLDGEPIAATPTSAMTRVFRRARRHRAAVGLVLLSAAIVVLGAVFFREATRSSAEQDTVRGAVDATTASKHEVERAIDEHIEQAIQDGDLDKIQEARETQRKVTSTLEKGQDLLLDLLPDIRDNKTIRSIGERLQQSGSLYSGLQELERYFREESGPVEGESAENDPRLHALTEWLGEAEWLSKGIDALDLSAVGLVTPGVESGAARGLTVVPAPGDDAPAMPATDVGPPRAPGSGARPRPGGTGSGAAAAPGSSLPASGPPLSGAAPGPPRWPPGARPPARRADGDERLVAADGEDAGDPAPAPDEDDVPDGGGR